MKPETLSINAYENVDMGETNTFLTDERRAVLTGEYEGAENVERTHKSRIRARARSALDELIQVARSEEIENAKVFDPEKLATLVFWVYNDPSQQPPGGLNADIDDWEGFSNSFENYRRAVYVEIDQQMRKFNQPDEGRF